MDEFIDNLGYNNFIIIITIIIVILSILIIVFIIEKISSRRNYKEALEAYSKEAPKVVIKEVPIKETIIVKEKINEPKKEEIEQETKNIAKEEIKEEKMIHNHDDYIPRHDQTHKIEFKKPDHIEIIKKEEPVTYDEHIKTKEEAKEELTEVTKKLVYEDKKKDLEGPTHFEREQEEMSIISYDELKSINYDVDESNDRLLEDEGNEPITIEELYKRHVEKQDEENLENTRKIDNPVFEETMDYTAKFKSSEVISPVFGVWKNKLKENTNEKEDFDKTMELDELEIEIKRTEEFLNELKSLKNKLD